MSKPTIVDLFCKAGGCTRGYQLAGFRTVGVDIEAQPHYCGDEFIQADALEFPLAGFDAVHASPPCQRFSTQSQGHKMNHPDLIDPIREVLRRSKLPYVIENVPQAPLREPVRLCGSSFGLGVRRHRHFETNWELEGLRCNHASQPPKYRVYDHGKWYVARTVPVYGTGGGKAKEHWADAMGIDWMTHAEMAEAIPPAFTEFIGAQLHDYLENRAAA